MRLVTQYMLLAWFGLNLELGAQTGIPAGTNATTRMLSRLDCVALALENNLTIRVVRHDPRIAYYNLRGAYAYYEPTFNFSASHGFRKEKNEFGETSSGLGTIAGRRTFYNSFGNDALLETLTPLGGTLSIGGNLDHAYGRTPDFKTEADGSQTYTGPALFDEWSGRAGITFTQPLLRNLWIDAGRLLIQLNKRQLRFEEQSLEHQVMRVIGEPLGGVEQSYYELIAARENVKVAEMALELADQLLSETKQRVQVGVAVPLDEKQVESEVATRKSQLVQARLNQSLSENALKRLLAQDYGEWYNVQPVPTEMLIAVPQTYDLNESWLLGTTLRPDYNQAKLLVEMKGIEVKYRKNQVFPSLDFVASYDRFGTDRSGSMSGVFSDIKLERDAGYTLGGVLSLPLGNSDARNRLKATREEMERLKDNLRWLHLSLLVEVENAVKRATAAYEQVKSTREARIFAEAALDAEQKKLAHGKTTSFFVLDFQNRVTTARYNEILALSEYNKRLVDLYYYEGSILQRNNIEVEYK